MRKNKNLFILLVLIFVVSCSDNETVSNQGPSFGYHVDRITRVNEGSSDIGTFVAQDIDGDEISYSISNMDMNISIASISKTTLMDALIVIMPAAYACPEFEEKESTIIARSCRG